MNLVLTGFSQDVDFTNLSETRNFIKLRRPNGSVFRLPVPEETIQALMREIAGQTGESEPGAVEQVPALDQLAHEEQERVQVDPQDQTEGATEFGGDETSGPVIADESELPPLQQPEGVPGQVELTMKDLIEEGMSQQEAADYLARQKAPRPVPPPARPPPQQRRVLRRPPAARQQRSLVPGGDDGVPGL